MAASLETASSRGSSAALASPDRYRLKPREARARAYHGEAGLLSSATAAPAASRMTR